MLVLGRGYEWEYKRHQTPSHPQSNILDRNCRRGRQAGGEATGLPFRGAVTYKNPLPLKLATANEKKKESKTVLLKLLRSCACWPLNSTALTTREAKLPLLLRSGTAPPFARGLTGSNQTPYCGCLLALREGTVI